MTVLDKKLVNTRWLYSTEACSREMGERVLTELEASGQIQPEITPSGRKYLSPREAEVFHEALRRR